MHPADHINLTLMRDGALHMVQIVLEEGWAEPTQTADYFSGYLGMELENWSQGDVERGRFDTPVITKVHSLGPAHRAQISSSQRSLRANGPFLFPYQLDVKTITGVVFDGKYHGVTKITEVDQFAHAAYEAHKPLLLEIALWTRANVRDITTDLQHTATGFFKDQPSSSPPWWCPFRVNGIRSADDRHPPKPSVRSSHPRGGSTDRNDA